MAEFHPTEVQGLNRFPIGDVTRTPEIKPALTGLTGVFRTITDLPDSFLPVTTQRTSIKPPKVPGLYMPSVGKHSSGRLSG